MGERCELTQKGRAPVEIKFGAF